MLNRLLNLVLCVGCLLCHAGEIYSQNAADKLQVDPPVLANRANRMERDVPVDFGNIEQENVKELEGVIDANLEPQDTTGTQQVLLHGLAPAGSVQPP